MKRGEIYFLNEQGQGSVQAGPRPVIVIQNDIGNFFSPTTIVCSITSATKPDIPTHLKIGKIAGLNKESTVLCEQIKTVNKEDLKTYIGFISNQDILRALNKRIQISLGLTQL